MALIDCPDCGKQVSSAAHACPHCGYPVAEKVGDATATSPASEAEPKSSQELVAEIRPSWWGYFWHVVFFFLVVPPIIAKFKRDSTVLRVYTDRVSLERGLLNKCVRDFRPQDIRAIDVDQTFWQRLVGIGDITLSTAAVAEGTEQMTSIPDPRGVRDLILAQRGGK